jgi:tripartite-type tricarboxylate transporter receptor subunit TctC
MALAALVTLAVAFSAVRAQAYPVRPIRLIVPLAPGGGNDTAARIVGHKLTEMLGQQVVVENRPGGGSVIASEIVVNAPADGHVLYLVSTAFTVAPALQKSLRFDSLRDFTPITRVSIAPGALIVHPSLPVTSVKGLIALARARPDRVTYSSAGIGSGSHLGGALFAMLAGVNLVHVPYKGSALASAAVLSGETAVAFTNPTSSLPQVKAGRLRMIAVTAAERWPLLPDLPTMAESGVPGYELLIWNGLEVRAGTPQAIIMRLHRDVTQLLREPDVIGHFANDGSRPQAESPQAFGAFLENEIAKWKKVVPRAGITAG